MAAISRKAQITSRQLDISVVTGGKTFSVPWGPGSPGGPCIPGVPGNPSAPLAPFSPGVVVSLPRLPLSPGSPGSPFSPGTPEVPLSPAEKRTVQLTVHKLFLASQGPIRHKVCRLNTSGGITFIVRVVHTIMKSDDKLIAK